MKTWSPALLAIDGYQKYISPHKGFCCAHRIATGGPSCSDFVRRLIAEQGLFASLGQIRQRLRDCKEAAVYLNEQRKKRRDTSPNGASTSDKACAYLDALSCVPSGCTDTGLGSIAGGATGGCDACACTPF